MVCIALTFQSTLFVRPFVRSSVRPSVLSSVCPSVRPNARKSVGFLAVERAYGRASLQVCASICIGFSSLLSIQQVLPPLSPLPPGVNNSKKNAKESFSIKKEKKTRKKKKRQNGRELFYDAFVVEIFIQNQNLLLNTSAVVDCFVRRSIQD